MNFKLVSGCLCFVSLVLGTSRLSLKDRGIHFAIGYELRIHAQTVWVGGGRELVRSFNNSIVFTAC